MTSASARRFHEEGIGSRTGLRIRAVERDAEGNEDLDAFFAESKRVLDWMDHSEDEGSASTARPSRTPTPEQGGEWDRRVARISELAANSLGDHDEQAAPPDDSLWESSVDVSVDRTFNLTELAGDAPLSPERGQGRRSSYMPGDEPSWLQASVRRPPAPRQLAPLSPLSASGAGYSPPAMSPMYAYDQSHASSSRASSAARDTPPLEIDSGSGTDYGAVVPSPPKKRGRGRPRKSETLRAAAAAGYGPPRGRPGRPPGRQLAPQKIIEQIHDPPSWQLENTHGLRRGKRHRIAPLDWWRGERALYGRGDRDEAPLTPFGLIAPVLKEVVRVPRAPDEGTFAGMRRFRKPMTMYAPPLRAAQGAAAAYPVEESDPYGVVYDPDQGTEVTMRACVY